MFYLLTLINGEIEACAGSPARLPARAMQLWQLGMVVSIAWVGPDNVPVPVRMQEAA